MAEWKNHSKKSYGAYRAETQQLLSAGKESGKVKESPAVGMIVFLLPEILYIPMQKIQVKV